MAKLIMTADDYGLCEEVNEGIRDCVKNGTITSVQVLVNMVSDKDMTKLKTAVDQAEVKFKKRCGIGLHFNNTEGGPITDGETTLWDKSKIGGRYFYTIDDLDCDKIDIGDLRKEFKLQYQKLQDYLSGFQEMDSVSSHNNIHFFRAEYLDMMLEETPHGTPFRSPVRWWSDDLPETEKYSKSKFDLPILPDGVKTLLRANGSTKSVLWNALKNEYLLEARRKIKLNHKVPVNCCEEWYGQSSYDYLKWLIPQLRTLQNAHSELMDKPGSNRANYVAEIFTHPSAGEGTKQLNTTYPLRMRRKEYDTLALLNVRNFFNECHQGLHGVDICSYRDALQ